jgi:RNA-binding protein
VKKRAAAGTPLGGKQRRYLRGLGHALDPVVQVGKEGVTDGVVAALEVALTTHELVKVKLGQSAPVDRHEAAGELAARTESELVQVLGKAVLLYRAHPEDPRIELP